MDSRRGFVLKSFNLCTQTMDYRQTPCETPSFSDGVDGLTFQVSRLDLLSLNSFGHTFSVERHRPSPLILWPLHENV